MFKFTTGNLLESDAEALVNTVNCEGYMGKGIAYQFKMQFPENNADYVKACNNGTLTTGKLHYYMEKGKIIINFPTKDKWRQKSKLEFIETGLTELAALIERLGIKSIAIPPLGSGNGGLVWSEVKGVIIEMLSGIANSVDIYIYEPSKSYSSQPVIEPKLSTSALVLMGIKERLNKFDKFRLQKAAYFVDVFSEKKYFKFDKYKYGPYDHAIDVISKKISEFQTYHGTISTKEARDILYSKIVSEAIDDKLSELMQPIEKACSYVNQIESDHELECLSTICFLIERNNATTTDAVLRGFKLWSEEKASRFTESEIISGIDKLCQIGIIDKNLIGYDFIIDSSVSHNA